VSWGIIASRAIAINSIGSFLASLRSALKAEAAAAAAASPPLSWRHQTTDLDEDLHGKGALSLFDGASAAKRKRRKKAKL